MPDRTLRIVDAYASSASATLFLGDRLEFLRQIAAAGDKAELVVTSPPYNVGKEYEKATSLDEYIEGQKATITACAGILAPNGSICWQVGHYIDGVGKGKEAFPLDLVLYPVFKNLGFKLRNRIVWTFGHGLHEKYRFSGRHETILWFTWDREDYIFNLDPIRIPQKYPGKWSFRGPKKGELSGNPLGKNPGDVWDIPNVKSNHVEKTDHPCQFPVALVERLVLALSNQNGLVVDPYLGVGTTAVAAYRHARRAAGADIVAEYLDIARERLAQEQAGELKTRPLNQPVYTPDSHSSLARLPNEWNEAAAPARLLDQASADAYKTS